MIRRFVNLVAAKPDSCVYSLHRLDVAKHLFYPSTAEAEAANAKEEDHSHNNHNGGGRTRRPSRRIQRLGRLPEPILRFRQQFPPSYWFAYDQVVGCPRVYPWSPPNEMFALLSPSGSRIFHATEEGHAVLYDADDSSITTLPSLDGPFGFGGIAIPIAASAAAAADDRKALAADKERESRLYVMTSHHSRGHVFEFQVLDVTGQHPPRWDPLPPPPLAGNESLSSIASFTVVDGGSTICVSTMENRTYCFDTRSRRWWHAGDWMLPFDGRAEYVPELDAWLGLRFSRWYNGADHGQLCASSNINAAIDMDAAHREPPTLQHVWEDLSPPEPEEETIQLGRRFNGIVIRRTKGWKLLQGDLISLGGGGFCVAKVFQVEQAVRRGFEDLTQIQAAFVVLTGVEVLRDGEGGRQLRMVKHRSKRYMLTTDRDVIQWVL